VDADLPAGAVAVAGWEPGLRLMTDNLVENAARHGRNGDDGPVAIRVAVEPPSAGAGPRLLVDDDGPGVAEADRDRIFEPFARAGRVGGRPGSGLGLALVAQQARHHGADVEVTRSPLGGARFVVAFPAPASGPQSTSRTARA